MTEKYFDQHAYTIRCEWGAHGIAALAPDSDVIVIVDVLSFSTCVDVAVARGALIYPYPWKDESAERFATSINAALASSDRATPGGYSLSPASLRTIPAGTRMVLPSPNGATLSHATGATPTLAGCLRNARAIAQLAQTIGRRVSIIAAGERWPDGSLRPALEDWIGAGAIIAHLAGSRSPEAEAAQRSFLQIQPELERHITECSSGRELTVRGHREDVEIATELNVSTCAPILIEAAYQRYA
jgi:2-phosphosulfolactate phosphatase